MNLQPTETASGIRRRRRSCRGGRDGIPECPAASGDDVPDSLGGLVDGVRISTDRALAEMGPVGSAGAESRSATTDKLEGHAAAGMQLNRTPIHGAGLYNKNR